MTDSDVQPGTGGNTAKWEYSCPDCNPGVIREQNPIKCPNCGGGPLVP